MPCRREQTFVSDDLLNEFFESDSLNIHRNGPNLPTTFLLIKFKMILVTHTLGVKKTKTYQISIEDRVLQIQPYREINSKPDQTCYLQFSINSEDPDQLAQVFLIRAGLRNPDLGDLKS